MSCRSTRLLTCATRVNDQNVSDLLSARDHLQRFGCVGGASRASHRRRKTVVWVHVFCATIPAANIDTRRRYQRVPTPNIDLEEVAYRKRRRKRQRNARARRRYDIGDNRARRNGGPGFLTSSPVHRLRCERRRILRRRWRVRTNRTRALTFVHGQRTQLVSGLDQRRRDMSGARVD